LSDIILQRDTDSIRAVVPQRTTLSSLLTTHQLLATEATALVETLSEKFDLRRISGRTALSTRALLRRACAGIRI
jgi:hypothetical protein